MTRASDEGIIFIDGSGPTYATETVFTASLKLLSHFNLFIFIV